MSNEVRCPKCSSSQLSANKKGFSGKKAVAGAVLTGGIGLLAGTIGSNKILITCLNCGHQFKPGLPSQPNKPRSKGSSIAMKVFMLIFLIISIMGAIAAIATGSWGVFALMLVLCLFFAVGVSAANSNIKAAKK